MKKLIGTEFQINVWEEIKKIPKGQTRTYKEIALALKKPKSSRAVANACGKNPFLIEISHIIFAITILLVLFFSTDILMNLFCYNVILITIISRWYFGGCLMLKCNEVNISFIPNMDYSIFYSSGFLLIIMKLLYLI